MANCTKCICTIFIIMAMMYQALGTVEDSDRNVLALNFPYGRGLDNEMQLAKLLLLLPPRFCHPKRNSELINSLLGLPKNMNNAGK